MYKNGIAIFARRPHSLDKNLKICSAFMHRNVDVHLIDILLFFKYKQLFTDLRVLEASNRKI